jgi:hypothetical protein
MSTPSPDAERRRHTWAVRALLLAATALAVLSIFAIWANRQLLNADNWSKTSTQLLENPQVRSRVAAYLVDEVYANVDVAAEIRSGLPPQLAPLAGPAAGGLRNLAETTTDRALGRPRVQQVWAAANRLTAEQLIRLAEGDSRAVTASGSGVYLDLRVVLVDVVGRLGLSGRLAGEIPPGAGRVKVLDANQLSAVQDGAQLLKGLALVLPVLSLAAFGLAVWLARRDRRRTLLLVGLDLIAAGVLVLIARTLLGNAVVDSVAPTGGAKPAAEATWQIATSLLRDVAQASIVIGIPVVLAALLAGPARAAVDFRRVVAPWLRDRPDLTYGVVATLGLLVVLWGPIPATQQVIPVLVMAVLVVLGVETLRRQTADEFPPVAATPAAPVAKEYVAEDGEPVLAGNGSSVSDEARRPGRP